MTNDQEAIEFIKKELLNGDTVKSSKLRWDKDKNLPYDQYIRARTNYLPYEIKYSERIYHILNDLKEVPLCLGCSSHVKFISINTGYSKLCKNYKCIRDNVEWKSSSDLKKKRYEETLNNFKNYYCKNTNVIDTSEMIKFIDARLQDSNSGRRGRLFNEKHFRYNMDILSSILLKTSEIKPVVISSIKKFEDLDLSERVYILKNNIQEIPKCPTCISNRKYISLIVGYGRACSKTCWKDERLTGMISAIQNQGFTVDNDIIDLKSSKFALTCSVCSKSHERQLTNGRWKNIYCESCNKVVGVSEEENELFDFLKSISSDAIQSYRPIDRREIDIFIPSRKIGIEYNGIYWHSTNDVSNILEFKKKHLDKTNWCISQGIPLIQICSSEWSDPVKNDIWKSMLSYRLGKITSIYARKCSIESMSSEESDLFLKANHLQGSDKSSVRYKLIHDQVIVSVMTFNKSRYNKNYEWELSRFCNLKGYTVVGGAERLLRHFIKNINPVSIVTYANRRYSNGNLYDTIGFRKLGISPPNHFYIKGGKSYSRNCFQKHLLKDKLEFYNPDHTEVQNMLNNGYRILFDCGNISYGLII